MQQFKPKALMGELFDRSKKTISEHLQNLFEEGELDPDSVVRNFRTTAADAEDLKAIEDLEEDLKRKEGKA